MDLKGVKNIIFDLGGVIINLNQELTFQAFQKLFPNQFNEIQQQLKQNNWLEKFETSEISEEDFLSFFESFNSEITSKQLKEAWNTMLLDIPIDRIDLIKKLSYSYNIYLLSNTNKIHLEHITKYVSQNFKLKNLEELFKKAYYSNHLGLRKPNKAIFEAVLKDAQLNAEETLFIDDSMEHIESAKILGIKTHHLNLVENQNIIGLFYEN